MKRYTCHEKNYKRQMLIWEKTPKTGALKKMRGKEKYKCDIEMYKNTELFICLNESMYCIQWSCSITILRTLYVRSKKRKCTNVDNFGKV